jgi:hypothetical protein
MRRSALVLAAGVLVLAASACDSGSGDVDAKDDDGIEVSATAAPCTDLLKPADPAATLTGDLPVIAGLTVYEKRQQGATAYYFAHIPGNDVVKVRDDARFAIEHVPFGKGYTVVDADAEPPAEAEFSFEGTHEGSVQVIPLCAGHLRVRYKVVK